MWPILILALFGIGTGVAIAKSKKAPPKKTPPPIAPAQAPARVVDKTLKPQEASAVQKALDSNTSPIDLINFANTLRPAAPQAAAQLEARAQALHAKGIR